MTEQNKVARLRVKLIDATGVGRPVCDMFTLAGIRFTGVIITAGHESAARSSSGATVALIASAASRNSTAGRLLSGSSRTA